MQLHEGGYARSMDIIGEIIEGVASGVRGVLGIPEGSSDATAAADPVAAGRPNASVATTFDASDVADQSASVSLDAFNAAFRAAPRNIESAPSSGGGSPVTSGRVPNAEPTFAARSGASEAERHRRLSPALTERAAVVRPPHELAQPAAEPPANDDPALTPIADPWGTATSNVARADTVTAAEATPHRGIRTNATARVFDATIPDSAGSARFVGSTVDLAGSANQDARIAAQNVQGAIDYYASTFGRNGIDDLGSGVDIVLNDSSKDASGRELFKGNGGYYATPAAGGVSEAIRYGSGNAYHHARGGVVSQYSMLYADDFAIHEYTHGVIRKETGKLGGEADESGATNEAIADIMAAAATRDWIIGEKMYSSESSYRMMRNIANPNDPTAVHGLWTSMSEVRAQQAQGKEAEEHWASGVLSTAAYRVQQRIGEEAGWTAVEQVFYDVINQHLLGSMSFSDVASGVRQAAGQRFGFDSETYAVFDEELRRAGL